MRTNLSWRIVPGQRRAASDRPCGGGRIPRYAGRLLWLGALLALAGVVSLSLGASAAPAAQPGGEDEPVVYVVEPGDTLYEIALMYGVSLYDIAAANNLEDPSLLDIGQELVIPTAAMLPTPTAQPSLQPPLRPSPQPSPLPSPPSSARTESYCAANTTVRELALPADPIRLVARGSQLFVVADGDLWVISTAALEKGGPLAPVRVTPTQRRVGQYAINELVYAAVDPAGGDLFLLDKTNDIFRYSADGTWQMEVAAAPIPGQFPDPQYLAIQPAGDRLYALDSDLSSLWRFAPGALLPYASLSSERLLTAVDMALTAQGSTSPSVFLLTRDGEVQKYVAGSLAEIWRPGAAAAGVPWPAQILAARDAIVVVEGQQRSLTALSPDDGQTLWQATFRFDGMQRLRSAAVMDSVVFALAGRNLYIGNRAKADADCPPVAYDDTLYFDGQDVTALMPGYRLPFAGATLPMRPRSYPGARRLYRYGIHKGVDLYATEVPSYDFGSGVLALAGGHVLRADSDFREMTPGAYEALIAQTEAQHWTSPEAADALLGRQIHIEHANGVQSWYGHLASIGSGILEGAPVQQGAVVGQVGVSGTSSGVYGNPDAGHLHFELWIDGRYLGQGLSLYETMRLWQAVFEGGGEPAQAGETEASEAVAVAPVDATPAAASATAWPADFQEPETCLKPPDDYTRTDVNDRAVNARTKWMLERAVTLYQGRGDPLRVVQGSYVDTLAESFGTHAGGGAVDISIRVKANPDLVMSDEEAEALVLALRQAGFAAWFRLPNDMNMEVGRHIHAIAIGDKELSPPAYAQVYGEHGYFAHLDGIPPEMGGPHPDRHGGPIICRWMLEQPAAGQELAGMESED